jgi:hypothetical protein
VFASAGIRRFSRIRDEVARKFTEEHYSRIRPRNAAELDNLRLLECLSVDRDSRWEVGGCSTAISIIL